MDTAVITGTWIDSRQVLPGFAPIETAIDAASECGFDDGIDYAAIAREQAEADSAFVAARQSISQLRPGRSAIGCAEDAAAGTTAVESPALALALIHGGEDHV